MPHTTPTQLVEALVAEVANALGRRLGVDARIAAAGSGAQPGWAATVTVGEPVPGSVTCVIGHEECAALAAAVSGETESGDAAVADLLRDVFGQAVGALRETPSGSGLLFCVETPARVETLPEGAPRTFQILLGDRLAATIASWPQFDAATKTAAPPAASPSRRGGEDRGHAAGVPANLDVILDIDLPLSVRFGQTDLTLDELSRLGPGSVIDLGRSPDDAVDVLVNGRLVARAEVVVVGGNYGVRITEVVSAADRVRTLSA
jgi:flagellar motor switch protein FliN